VIEWLNENLAVPTRFSLGRRRGARHDGICWLKGSAAEHISKMRDLARIVEMNGS